MTHPSGNEPLLQSLVDLHCWMLYGREPGADRLDESAIAQRAIAAGYVVSPELMKGKSLDRYATDHGWSPKKLNSVACEFATRFGLPHDDRSDAINDPLTR